MKSVFIIGLSMVLAGCGTFNNKDEPIRNQRLSTSFKNDSIKIETDCVWYKFWKNECEVVSIESTATASTNGNTESNRRTALIRAADRARANVRHFIQEDLSSTRTQNTIAKNIEKASDTTNTNVSMSDTEADQEKSNSLRVNSNDTAYQLTETIRVNASGILRGFYVSNQEVVGKQEVSVTIRWNKESEGVSNQLRRKFSR
jgi:hypothetical protein